MARLPCTCSSSYATLNCADEVTWVLLHQQDGGFIDVSVMISTLEHNKSSTPLGQTITASQWVKIKPIGSIKAFIRVHHPFSLIFGFISSPLQWIVDFCTVFKHKRYEHVWPVDLNAVHYCYSFFFLLTAKIKYQPALTSQRQFLMQNMPVGHMNKFSITYQTVSGRQTFHIQYIFIYILGSSRTSRNYPGTCRGS